ncbi:MAG: hypothetical protein JSS54_08045 [Proteobacteria bacterium]|nr:hypothetical protein [Pseudomonadota bacterium]
MGFKTYQLGELIGIVLLLGSTAMQMFYLDPLKREIEWRLAAFSIQQSAQVQIKAVHDNRIVLLQAVNAPADKIREAEAAVLGLFALGTLLAGFGRAMEMRAGRHG